jgi:hypothetical protein
VKAPGPETCSTTIAQTGALPTSWIEREVWSVAAEAVTHLRADIMPDTGGRVGRATLTSLSLACSHAPAAPGRVRACRSIPRQEAAAHAASKALA